MFLGCRRRKHRLLEMEVCNSFLADIEMDGSQDTMVRSFLSKNWIYAWSFFMIAAILLIA